MHVRFSKMHGLGNDFMVIDSITQRIFLNKEQIRKLADRHFGIGFDQLLIVEPPRNPEMDFRYRIFNADGGEVENCGNGARCFVRFVRDQRLTNKNAIRVETAGGPLTLSITPDERVEVNMGKPGLTSESVPFKTLKGEPTKANAYRLPLDAPITLENNATVNEVEVGVVSMGNPHAVIRVDSAQHAPVEHLGPVVEQHPRFPKRVNVGFMQVVDRQHIKLRVYERGAGETLACGTGACAAVVSGIQRGWLDHKVEATLKGGKLTIEWQGEGHPVIMTGPAVKVYDGRLDL